MAQCEQEDTNEAYYHGRNQQISVHWLSMPLYLLRKLRVSVDQKTDEYYQSVKGPFGEELRQKIDRNNKPAYMKLGSILKLDIWKKLCYNIETKE